MFTAGPVVSSEACIHPSSMQDHKRAVGQGRTTKCRRGREAMRWEEARSLPMVRATLCKARASLCLMQPASDVLHGSSSRTSSRIRSNGKNGMYAKNTFRPLSFSSLSLTTASLGGFDHDRSLQSPSLPYNQRLPSVVRVGRWWLGACSLVLCERSGLLGGAVG